MLSAIIERGINGFLALDPTVKQHWHKLIGHQIELVILPLEFSIYFKLTEQGIELLKDQPNNIDTRIKGTPLVFLQSSLGKIPKNLIIEGNVELGKELSDILRHIDIDWEAEVATLIGDVPAYQLGRLTRRAQRFLHTAGQNLQENLTEYLQEEAKLLPARLLLQDFYQDVDQLHNDVERLAARVKRLE